MSKDSTDHTADVPHLPRVDVRRGTLWMLVSLVFFSGNALLIKHFASDRQIDPWLTLSFRFGLGLMATIGLFGPGGSLRLGRTFASWLLASRGIMGAFGTAAYYFSIGPLGAGKATLIGNTWSVWSAIMATLVLGERLGIAKLAGILLALLGLAMLTDISTESLAHAGKWEAVSLGGAILAAMVVVVVRQLTKTESSATIYASQCVYGLLLALPLALRETIHLSSGDLGLLCLAALFASLGQLAMTEGFRFLTVAAGGSFQLAVPLIISLGGIMLFNEHFNTLQSLGGLLILLGSFQTVAGVRWHRPRNCETRRPGRGP